METRYTVDSWWEESDLVGIHVTLSCTTCNARRGIKVPTEMASLELLMAHTGNPPVPSVDALFEQCPHCEDMIPFVVESYRKLLPRILAYTTIVSPYLLPTPLHQPVTTMTFFHALALQKEKIQKDSGTISALLAEKRQAART